MLVRIDEIGWPAEHAFELPELGLDLRCQCRQRELAQKGLERQVVDIGWLVGVSGPLSETSDFGKESPNGGVFD